MDALLLSVIKDKEVMRESGQEEDRKKGSEEGERIGRGSEETGCEQEEERRERERREEEERRGQH
eukprot:2790101-Rhodomonas_salina.1